MKKYKMKKENIHECVYLNECGKIFISAYLVEYKSKKKFVLRVMCVIISFVTISKRTISLFV